MNWEAISAISEVVGAKAVVITLIYLALQIRQNTAALRGTTLDAITAQMRDELRWSAELAPVWRKVLQSPDEMTFEDSWQLSEWVTGFFNARQNEWHQYQQGLIDKEVWSTIEGVIRILTGIEWMQVWWRDYGSKNLIPSFVAEVERIAAAEQRDTAAELSNLLNIDSKSGTIKQ